MRTLLTAACIATTVLLTSAQAGEKKPADLVDKAILAALEIPELESFREKKFKVQLAWDQGAVLVFAANEFTVEKDGRIKLAPASYVWFSQREGKLDLSKGSRGDAKVLWLEFDKAVRTPTEMRAATLKAFRFEEVLVGGFEKK